ncbi:MAG: fibrobacter succinogenes major paralogous domain-containing protein [Bacteroidales bacterium]|nr:fibrobacter succinogenes major paralogous domain-containing protein [Bacteroidales bacterium]
MKPFSIQLLNYLTILLLTSCAPLQKGIVVYEGRQDEIIATERIKSFISNNPNPSIVLRVPITEKQATQSDPNSYIYNAIEKELVIAGFNVKDRGLFNEIVNSTADLDYTRLKELTGTELILELVRIDLNVEHKTNKIYDKKGEVRLSEDYLIIKIGAAIEFKLIIVDGNDYGGSYSFYLTPCTDINSNNCNCFVGYKNYPKKVYPYVDMCNEVKKGAFEYIDQDVMEDFVRQGVKLMVHEIKERENTSLNSKAYIKKANVITEPATEIGYFSVKLNGEVLTDIEGSIIQKGFSYSENNKNPQITDNAIYSEDKTNKYSSILINLSPNRTYYFRAFIKNNSGIEYGSTVQFSTTNQLVYDINGNAYKIISIGNQVWMAENLRTNKLNDGMPIFYVSKKDTWESHNPSFCFYNNLPKNGEKYGALYNWEAVKTGKLCPLGWSVPASHDYNILETYLGGPSVAGGYMKEKLLIHWAGLNIGATNSSGFSGLLSGKRDGRTDTFIDEGTSAYFWTTLQHENEIHLISLRLETASLINISTDPNTGASVRCIKDN